MTKITELFLYLFPSLVNAASFSFPLQTRRGHRHDTAKNIQLAQSQRILAPFASDTTPVGRIQDMFGLYLLANISIGTPPQSLPAILDLSWPHVTIPNTECGRRDDYGDNCKRAINLFNESLSETLFSSGQDIDYEYAWTYLRGKESADTVALGDIAVERQYFSSVYDASPIFAPIWAGDAVLGLALEHPDDVAYGTFMRNVMDRELLDRNVVSFLLAEDDDNEPGELHLGGVDPAYAEQLVELPVNDIPGFDLGPWHVPAHSLTIEGEEEYDLDNGHAIFLTDEPTIGLPLDIGERLLERIGSVRNRDVECEQRDKGPLLTFTLGPNKDKFTLSPKEYIRKVQGPNGPPNCVAELYVSYKFDDAGPNGSSLITLSHSFLRGFYSVFDFDNRSISLARLDR